MAPAMALTVLVIEDDPDAREVIAEILRGEGYQPVEVADGRAALASLRAGLRPSLIILDMLMPGMDGWQFRRAQCSDESLAKIPVVVVSGVRAARNSAMQGGAVAFLSKPVAPDALLLAVANAC
jgi:CheY-like chemotaxis protein